MLVALLKQLHDSVVQGFMFWKTRVQSLELRQQHAALFGCQILGARRDDRKIELTAKRKKLLQSELCDTSEDAAPVLKKVHKPGKATPDPIHGLFEAEVNGKSCVVEYEPDTGLRDSEQVPLLEEGGIEAFFRREVLPYTPDAWLKMNATKIGYEVSFTRHFYQPPQLRTLAQISADILALEQETEGLLNEITKGVTA